jgi:hypothetical protein
MAQHLSLRLVVVASALDRGCCRCRPKGGVIGQPLGPQLLPIRAIVASQAADS